MANLDITFVIYSLHGMQIHLDLSHPYAFLPRGLSQGFQTQERPQNHDPSQYKWEDNKSE